MPETVIWASNSTSFPSLGSGHKTLCTVFWKQQELRLLSINFSKDSQKLLRCIKQSSVTKIQSLERKANQRHHHLHWWEDPQLLHPHLNTAKGRNPRRRAKRLFAQGRHARSTVLLATNDEQGSVSVVLVPRVLLDTQLMWHRPMSWASWDPIQVQLSCVQCSIILLLRAVELYL